MDRDDEIKRRIDEVLSNKDLSIRNQIIDIMRILAPILADAEKWDALTKKYPHFCTRFDPEIDGEVKDETK